MDGYYHISRRKNDEKGPRGIHKQGFCWYNTCANDESTSGSHRCSQGFLDKPLCCVHQPGALVPVTLAAIMSSTGNLAFTLSKQWARFMLFATGVKVVIRNRERSVRAPRTSLSPTISQSMIFSPWSPAWGSSTGGSSKRAAQGSFVRYALYVSRNIFIDRSDPVKAIESINVGLDRLPPGVGVLFFAEGSGRLTGPSGSSKGRVHHGSSEELSHPARDRQRVAEGTAQEEPGLRDGHHRGRGGRPCRDIRTHPRRSPGAHGTGEGDYREQSPARLILDEGLKGQSEGNLTL